MASPFNVHDFDENLYAAVEEFLGDAAGYGVTEDEEDDDDEDEEEDEEEEEDDDDEDYVAAVPSPRVSQEGPRNPPSNEVIVIPDVEPQNCVEEEGNKRRRTEGGEASCSCVAIGTAEGSQGNECNTDNLICPICMDVWTNKGEHNICCLPCGHIYGMSCIKRWLQQRKNSGKCPQCNRKCSLKDVRKLYASRVVSVDEESQKRIKSLEVKCADLERKDGDWRKKEAEWQNREAALRHKVQKLTERNTYLEQLQLDMQSRQSGLINGNVSSQWRYESERNCGSKFHGKGSFCNFEFQRAFHLDGARAFDMEPSNNILLVAQKPKGIGGAPLLTKMSLICPFEMEDILLPSTSYGIRDLHISPSGSLALYASLGKKLSVLSLDSNNLVVNYNLQAPAWSCSWDLNSTHYIYAGLQDGSVLVFDMRQTAGPMETLVGLTNNPVHTVQSLAQTSSLSSGGRTILSASAIGLCQWSIDSQERPFVVPESDNQGVCISVAYCPSSDEIVVSYRPKFDNSVDMPLTLSPSPNGIGQGVQGSHVLFKRMGNHHFQKVGSSYANVSKIRLPKSIIIDMENQSRLFVSGDEMTSDLVLHELPSFRVIQQFKMPAQARDIRYSPSHGILGCLSENTLQLFDANLS